jgi:predicted nuclease of predicted toxin-antitoxin system
MKFIVDAQLPYRLALYIRQKGHDAIHTDDLPDKERTTDSEIRRIAQQDNRVVISKDSDFLDSHLIV